MTVRVFGLPFLPMLIESGGISVMATPSLQARWGDITLGSLFGATDFKQTFEKTFLGPLWLSIGLVLQSLILSIVISELSNLDFRMYFLHVSTGLLFWTYFQSSWLDATRAHSASKAVLIQFPVSLLFPPARTFTRNTLQFFLNAFALLIVDVVFFHISWHVVASGLGAAAAFVTTVAWFVLLVSLFTLRLPDLAPASNIISVVLFYATPVLWVVPEENAGARGIIASVNPLAWLIGMAKGPQTSLLGYVVVLALIVIAGIVMLHWFSNFAVRQGRQLVGKI